MPAHSPRSTARLLAVAVLAIAVVAVVLVMRAARQPADAPPSRALRSAAISTPGTIPYATGTGYPEGAVLFPGASPATPPAESRIRLAVPLDAWSGIVDHFGSPRGEGLVHGGIDFGFSVPAGSPVYAACSGMTAFAGSNDGYGLHLIVNCDQGWSTVYASMGELYVANGEPVAAGTALGLSDSSGRPLHFEVRWRDVPQNPETYVDLRNPRPRPPTATPIATPGSARSAGSPATRTAEPLTPTLTSQPTATATRRTTPTPVDRR